MRLRTALVRSKNLVSVRILQAISPQYAQDYIARFGFDPKLHPPYLTMALGAGNVTPMQMAAAYSIFEPLGFRSSVVNVPAKPQFSSSTSSMMMWMCSGFLPSTLTNVCVICSTICFFWSALTPSFVMRTLMYGMNTF